MEVKANEIFTRYAKLYYDENFLTSVYFFDTDDNGFGSCWLVKKSKYNNYVIILIYIAQSYPGSDEDSVWDSIHVVKTTLE